MSGDILQLAEELYHKLIIGGAGIILTSIALCVVAYFVKKDLDEKL